MNEWINAYPDSHLEMLLAEAVGKDAKAVTPVLSNLSTGPFTRLLLPAVACLMYKFAGLFHRRRIGGVCLGCSLANLSGC